MFCDKKKHLIPHIMLAMLGGKNLFDLPSDLL